MLTQMSHELFPSTRILVLQLHPRGTESEGTGERRGTIAKKALRGRVALLLECLALRFRRTRATAGDHQRSRHLRISHPEMQRRESAHAEPDDVGFCDRKMFYHRGDIVGRV